MRAVICKGDRTSHGGRVLEGNPHVTTGGRQVAQIGHNTFCPLCKGKFPIVEGAGNHVYGGVGTALEGMRTACGATLIASQHDMVVDAGGGSRAPAPASQPRVVESHTELPHAQAMKPDDAPAVYDSNDPLCTMPKWGSAEWARRASNKELDAYYNSLLRSKVVAVDPNAEARLEYQRQTTRNSIGMSMLSGIPGAGLPGQLSRYAGLNEYRVADANEIGGALAGIGTSFAAMPARGSVSVAAFVHREMVTASEIRQRVLQNIAYSRAARESSNFNALNVGLPSREWPPFPGSIGQVEKNATLLPGMLIDRFGPPQGTFLSPAGTSYSRRALKPGTYANDYYMYEVLRPLTVKAGEVRPWFGEMGYGTQYRLDPIDGVRRSPSILTTGENPYLREIYNGKYWNRPD